MATNDFLSFIPSFITALAGLITAIAGIIPILGNIQKTRNAKVPASSGTPSLQFLKVERTPLEKEEWRRFKKNTFVVAVICATFVVAIVGGIALAVLRFVLVPRSFSTEVLHLIAGSVALVILLINFVVYTYLSYLSISSYIIAGQNPEDARYCWFQETKIVVQSDYKDILVRCKEALKSISLEIVEYDFDVGILEANVSIGLKFYRGIMRVKVDRLKDDRCLIQVKLSSHFFKELPNAITNSSWIVNHFINRVERG